MVRAASTVTATRRAVLMAGLLPSLLWLGGCAGGPVPAPGGGRFLDRSVVVDGRTRRYRVFVPAVPGTARPPVVLFLHGSGERGEDGRAPTAAGLGPYVRAHAVTFPALVVFPQVPEGEEWSGPSRRTAFAALDAAVREFNGDADRVYLTGISMGGYGVWELALEAPSRFAALVPVCGAVKAVSDERALYVTEVADAPDPYRAIAERLRDMPVWIFHGGRDDVVPPRDDRLLAAAFRAAGAKDARYTELPEANHNSWDETYRSAAMWDWLFAHERQARGREPAR